MVYPRPVRLSPGRYFLYVAVVTTVGFAALTLVRPSLAHSVKALLRLESPPRVTLDSFYTQRIASLFDEHCTGCHGARRQKAQLRLDSLGFALSGGKHGAVIRAGNPKNSELFARISLPSANDRAMPPSSKPPLSADEITVVKLWIAAGASGERPTADFKDAPKAGVKVTIPEIDEAAVANERAGFADGLRVLQARFPNVIAYQSRGSADLEIDAALMGKSFGDAELTALVALADHIVWADFSGTAISDSSADTLKSMKRLRVLRLMNTKVTDRMAVALASLSNLQSVTVVGTEIAEASLRPLKNRGIKIYHDNP